MDGSFLTIPSRYLFCVLVCVYSSAFLIFYCFISIFTVLHFELLLCVYVQVVAVAVFLALGFAFYVFFAPFVGKQLYQYIVIGIYTPLVSLLCSSSLFTFVLYAASTFVFF